MATIEEIKNALNNWAKMLENPEIAEEFEGYNKTMQFIFPDINLNLQLVFKDKTAKVVDGFNDKAEMSLKVNSDLFMGISTGDIDPMEAFMNGELKPKGDLADLEKLEIFMDID
ncbi:unnamed protein product [marine sediment metagenome]|uniref:SCP2 domain-containing protein n=1 Tax=marine sediment metagenome TaxID=412755 RepID=X1C9I0_9ZZZZ